MHTRFSQRTQHVHQYKSMPFQCYAHMFFVVNQERYVFCSTNSSTWDGNYKKMPQVYSFNRVSLPSSVNWCHSCDKMDQAFPPPFFILQRSKNGRWEGRRTRLYNVCIDMRVCPFNINLITLFLPFFHYGKKCSRTLLHYGKNAPEQSFFHYGKNAPEQSFFHYGKNAPEQSFFHYGKNVAELILIPP